MKKLFKIFTILILSLVVFQKANAMSFEEAFAESNTKPMLVLLYADWADNCDVYLENFNKLQTEFGDQFNYVELDIASPDLKSFNKRYHVYPNLPYILMFRDGGKVSRYIQKNCAASSSCLSPRVKSFLQ